MDTFFSVGMLPTINTPTIITHTSATLIDNIYIKCNNYGKFNSGIIMNDISDHLPIFVCMGTKQKVSKKPSNAGNLMTDRINEISRAIDLTDWTSLESLPINAAFDFFNNKLLAAQEKVAPETKKNIAYSNIIRDPWMTPALLKSSKTQCKLYRAQIKKPQNDACSTKYVKFRNLFNTSKKS